MVELHAPVRVWGLGLPIGAIVAVVVLVVIALSRRRPVRVPPPRKVRVPPPRTFHVPAYPVVTSARGGRPYVWGVLLALFALAAVMWTFGRNSVRQVSYRAEFDDVPPTATVQREPKPHRQFWLTPKRPAPAELGPPWRAKIELPTFPSVPELNPQHELLEKIAKQIQGDFNLRSAPPLGFVADSRFVRNVGQETKQLPDKDPKYGEVDVITTHVELTQDGWRELGRLERTGRAQDRMVVAARGLGLLTVLLGAVAGYIRLDDWTKGYYSGRLFLAAAALVTGLGFAIVTV